jgi:hypothetical protein
MNHLVIPMNHTYSHQSFHYVFRAENGFTNASGLQGGIIRYTKELEELKRTREMVDTSQSGSNMISEKVYSDT